MHQWRFSTAKTHHFCFFPYFLFENIRVALLLSMVLAMTKPTQKIFQSNEDSKKDDNSFSVFFSVLFLDFKRRGNNSKDM